MSGLREYDGDEDEEDGWPKCGGGCMCETNECGGDTSGDATVDTGAVLMARADIGGGSMPLPSWDE